MAAGDGVHGGDRVARGDLSAWRCAARRVAAARGRPRERRGVQPAAATSALPHELRRLGGGCGRRGAQSSAPAARRPRELRRLGGGSGGGVFDVDHLCGGKVEHPLSGRRCSTFVGTVTPKVEHPGAGTAPPRGSDPVQGGGRVPPPSNLVEDGRDQGCSTFGRYMSPKVEHPHRDSGQPTLVAAVHAARATRRNGRTPPPSEPTHPRRRRSRRPSDAAPRGERHPPRPPPRLSRYDAPAPGTHRPHPGSATTSPSAASNRPRPYVRTARPTRVRPA